MIRFPAHALRRAITVTAVSALIGLAVVPSPARARVFVGVGIGGPWFGPAYLPPPYYYPPPVYYPPPPPVYYSPPQVYAPPQPVAPVGGQACYADRYVCPMDRPVVTGSACYCPGNGGQKVWGRAS